MQNIIKIAMTLLGVVIFTDCIIGDVDGIGRFVMILFATIFSIIGSMILFKK